MSNNTEIQCNLDLGKVSAIAWLNSTMSLGVSEYK